MKLTIKPSAELTELSKITGLTENELSNKIIHILDFELHCIEHWTVDAGNYVNVILGENEVTDVEFALSLGIEASSENRLLLGSLQLWGTGEHECDICGCETEIDHTEDLKFCLNPECGYKISTDNTDYDLKRKLKHDNN